ncbi:hypothetical protein X738_26940 [Mesorhizobium sp. LNHC209A00]|nr:hypothetical protein X738_26940 [Mesorhizobium sp. LNHC209A00]
MCDWLQLKPDGTITQLLQFLDDRIMLAADQDVRQPA